MTFFRSSKMDALVLVLEKYILREKHTMRMNKKDRKKRSTILDLYFIIGFLSDSIFYR